MKYLIGFIIGFLFGLGLTVYADVKMTASVGLTKDNCETTCKSECLNKVK